MISGKKKKITTMVGGTLVITALFASGFIAFKRWSSFRDLRAEMSGIPWTFDGEDDYR